VACWQLLPLPKNLTPLSAFDLDFRLFGLVPLDRSEKIQRAAAAAAPGYVQVVAGQQSTHAGDGQTEERARTRHLLEIGRNLLPLTTHNTAAAAAAASVFVNLNTVIFS